MRLTGSLLAALTLSLVGCGGGDNNNNPPVMAQPDMAMDPPDMATKGPYPAGPYGIQESTVMYPLKAKGFVLSKENTDSSGMTYSDVGIDVIWNNPKCKCLMLSEAARWCGPCVREQAVLTAAHDADETFCVFEVLVDGLKPGTRANEADLRAWTEQHQQNFPLVAANIQTYLHLPKPDALPTNVVINPRTMKILAIETGLGPTTIDDAKALCEADQ